MTNSINKYYPKTLVFMQFSLMAIMIAFSDMAINSIYAIAFWVLGAIIGIWAISYNKFTNFNIQPKLKENATLITSGAYKHIRHPMYFSIILAMIGVLINAPILYEFIFFILLVTTLTIKAKTEERLWSNHSKEYKIYMKNTKLFIPFVL